MGEGSGADSERTNIEDQAADVASQAVALATDTTRDLISGMLKTAAKAVGIVIALVGLRRLLSRR